MGTFSNNSSFEQLRLWTEQEQERIFEEARKKTSLSLREARKAIAEKTGITLPEDDMDRLKDITEEFRVFFEKAGSFDRKWLDLLQEAEDILKRQR